MTSFDPSDSQGAQEVRVQQGELFAGRYLIEQTLGAGGMGVVYRVLDQRLHRQAALKVMNPDLSHDPTFRERFEREAKAGAGFEHPNVVTVHHYDEHDGTLYLVTQYVDGRNLHRELDEGGPFSLERTVEVVRQLAAGLDAAHRHSQVHRDVKPANVLLGRDEHGRDHVLLTDFGLAQVLGSGEDRLTSTGTMLGTATYGSPEQFRGQVATVRSDVYSLACVTFEMLTGRPPFRGATDVETAGHHLSQPPPDLEGFGLPPQLSSVVARGLAKNPYDRPVSAGTFAQELAAAAVRSGPQTQIVALSPTGELPVTPSTRRWRVLAIAGVVIALAFGVGLAGGFLNGPGGG
jgi:serine/threonine-protein kinase